MFVLGIVSSAQVGRLECSAEVGGVFRRETTAVK
jgi:hypothetical protein